MMTNKTSKTSAMTKSSSASAQRGAPAPDPRVRTGSMSRGMVGSAAPQSPKPKKG